MKAEWATYFSTEEDKTQRSYVVNNNKHTNETNETAEKSEEGTTCTVYTEEQFIRYLAWTDKAYRAVVILSAVLALSAVFTAVFVKVSYGLMAGIGTVILYMGATSNILYSKLGVAYTSVSGELTITEIYGKQRQEIWIPRRLLWLDVVEIKAEACDHKSSACVKVIHLPATLRSIGNDAFRGCVLLEKICFEGSREQWEQIEKGEMPEGVEIICSEQVHYPEKPEKNKKRKKSGKDTGLLTCDPDDGEENK